jgi:hypothetical protein
VGLEPGRAAVFAVIYSKLSAGGVGDPQKSWRDGALAGGKTAESQRKNSKPSAIEALRKHIMSSRVYQAINAI